MIKLTIELVPRTCWFSNVRDHVSSKIWNDIKKITFSVAEYKCEICGERGTKHPVECHEIWDYNDSELIQTLIRTIALCPACHRVKHIGFAERQGLLKPTLAHLAKVNGWTLSQATEYAKLSFDLWELRSRHKWKLNIDWLNNKFNLNIETKR